MKIFKKTIDKLKQMCYNKYNKERNEVHKMFTVEVKKTWDSEWELWGTYPSRNEANEKAQIALEDNVDVFVDEAK